MNASYRISFLPHIVLNDFRDVILCGIRIVREPSEERSVLESGGGGRPLPRIGALVGALGGGGGLHGGLGGQILAFLPLDGAGRGGGVPVGEQKLFGQGGVLKEGIAPGIEV